MTHRLCFHELWEAEKRRPEIRLLCFHYGRFAADLNIFSRCLLTYRRLLAVFTSKFSSEELRGFKFKKRDIQKC